MPNSDKPTRPTATHKPTSSDAAVSDARPPHADAGPMSTTGSATSPAASARHDVADFVEKLRTMTAPVAAGRGRLVFAMDATMSRQPTWDMALGLQGEMFDAVKAVGSLDVQLVYFRGLGECRASKWVSDPAALARLMTTVTCAGGYTQIGKVISHARRETGSRPVNAVVYVGDAMEEQVDDLCGRAGELALLGVPMFMFLEGRDATAEQAYREIARLTKGAFCRFDQGSAGELRALLMAVAVYAAGGRSALKSISDRAGGAPARLLLDQMR
jgi:hypothetical protein